MLPSDQVDEPNSCRFFSLSEKKVYKLDNVVDGFRGWIFCVGSSYGWLVISDEKDNPSLLNPFSGTKIKLPSIIKTTSALLTALLEPRRIRKAILMSDPSRTENFQVAMLYSHYRTILLAFYKHGESNSWIDVVKNGRKANYNSITYHDDKLYAVYESKIDVWNIGNPFPTLVSTIEFSVHITLRKIRPNSMNFRCYEDIVESLGELFYVYLLTFYNVPTSIRAYEIRISKFNFSENRWEEQENLCGRTFFIANHQIMAVCARDFPECEENTVYFADNEREFGLYKLHINDDVMKQPLFQQDKSIKYPLPHWIVPNI